MKRASVSRAEVNYVRCLPDSVHDAWPGGCTSSYKNDSRHTEPLDMVGPNNRSAPRFLPAECGPPKDAQP
jgi:hypothetical protein